MARTTFFVVILFLAACRDQPSVLEVSGETMGTTYNIVAVDASAELDAGDVKSQVEQVLADVNGQMSNWDPNSEISQFNAAQTTEPIAISAELATVVRAANEVHEKSLGQFDVTLGPLIELWGFGPRNSESPVPTDAAIASALEVVGQSKVLALAEEPATLSKALPETSVYLAAIAKGYGVDMVAALLVELGLEDYLVEIGGDLLAAGENPEGVPWSIGIEKPDAGDRTVEEVISISGLGMATSGDYRNYFEEKGVRYSHIIDAETGRPIDHETASVTVLAESAMMADAWATAFLALGTARGSVIAEELDLAVYFIDRDASLGDDGFRSSSSSRFQALVAKE
ncbi:MAG: FAD:protein FMN transferase [Pseudomonadota bacterium]